MRLSDFFTVLALILTTISVQAQTTFNTVPEGVATFTLPATGSQNVTSYLALPLTSDPSYSGAVSSVTANSITVADNNPAPWTAGNLSTAAAPYFVKFLSGSEKGRVIKVTANTTNTLTLDTTDNSSQTVSLATTGFSVAVGDSFEVFPGDTLVSIFGSNATLLLKGASSVFTADSVSVYNPATIRWLTYYYNTTSGFWVMSGSNTNANNTILYPYGAVTITRRANEDQLSFVLMGRATEVPILTKTTGSNASIYGSTDYAVDMTLSQLQFGSNWIKGSSAFTADTLSIWDAAHVRFDTYYQLPTDSSWRKSTDPTTNQNNLVIPAGSTVSILQRGTVSGASSFLSSVMPYSVN